MTVSLERLVRESKESQKLQSELEIASQVQRQLFPKQLPNLSGLELTGICRPARVVSGDYYDYVEFDDRRLALAIGDIAGKGISAALVMAGVQSALHAQLYQNRQKGVGAAGVIEAATPDKLVRQLNRQLYDSTSASTFATFCYLTYDDAEGRLTYCNAGHLPPLIVGHDGTRRLTRGGIVLGILPDAVYEAESVILRHGDLLVCYTDGITEPENSYGGEFGEDRLIQVVQKVYDRSPREIANAVLQAVEEWSDSPEAADDMTLLVARRL
jgi:sigma-B regulation protein RsbU (phosphoserine phosphatase)